MSGIKHSQWMGWYPGMPEPSKDATPEERFLHKLQHHTTYCKLCGEQIVPADQTPTGQNVDWVWEMEHDVHKKCAREFEDKIRGRLNGN